LPQVSRRDFLKVFIAAFGTLAIASFLPATREMNIFPGLVDTGRMTEVPFLPPLRCFMEPSAPLSSLERWLLPYLPYDLQTTIVAKGSAAVRAQMKFSAANCVEKGVLTYFGKIYERKLPQEGRQWNLALSEIVKEDRFFDGGMPAHVSVSYFPGGQVELYPAGSLENPYSGQDGILLAASLRRFMQGNDNLLAVASLGDMSEEVNVRAEQVVGWASGVSLGSTISPELASLLYGYTSELQPQNQMSPEIIEALKLHQIYAKSMQSKDFSHSDELAWLHLPVKGIGKMKIKTQYMIDVIQGKVYGTEIIAQPIHKTINLLAYDRNNNPALISVPFWIHAEPETILAMLKQINQTLKLDLQRAYCLDLGTNSTHVVRNTAGGLNFAGGPGHASPLALGIHV